MGLEVDFVVYGPKGIWAIEVKNARKIHPADLRGLRSFQEEFPQGKSCLLYRGKDRLMKDGIMCLPCQDFLKSLRPGQSLDAFLS